MQTHPVSRNGQILNCNSLENAIALFLPIKRLTFGNFRYWVEYSSHVKREHLFLINEKEGGGWTKPELVCSADIIILQLDKFGFMSPVQFNFAEYSKDQIILFAQYYIFNATQKSAISNYLTPHVVNWIVPDFEILDFCVKVRKNAVGITKSSKLLVRDQKRRTEIFKMYFGADLMKCESPDEYRLWLDNWFALPVDEGSMKYKLINMDTYEKSYASMVAFWDNWNNVEELEKSGLNIQKYQACLSCL